MYTDKTNVLRFRCLSCFCDFPQRGYCECFDVKNHCLVKTKGNKKLRSQSFLKRNTTEDESSQIDIGNKKAKVTVLSDIRYRAENMGYDNIQNYKPFKLMGMKKISKGFDLTNSVRLWCCRNEEISWLIDLDGAQKMPKISDYWNTDVLYENNVAKKVMSRNRFEILLRCWHFEDAYFVGMSGADRLIKIRRFEKIL